MTEFVIVMGFGFAFGSSSLCGLSLNCNYLIQLPHTYQYNLTKYVRDLLITKFIPYEILYVYSPI